MSRLKQILTRMCNWRSESGYTLFETVIALGVASISVLGAFGLTLSIEEQYKGSKSLANMHGESRIAIERLFRELSETSNKTVDYTWNAISFASARGADGQFQLRPYSYVLKSHRPSWQKAIIYYILPDDDGVNRLYRAEVPKTNWSSNYDDLDTPALGELEGEFVADNIMYMGFDYYPAESLAKAHVLSVYMDFGSYSTDDPDKLPWVHLTTRVPLMNRTR